MKKLLEELKGASLAAVENAADLGALESIRINYLGKKGSLTAVLKQMGGLSADERPVIGQLANEIRTAIENDLENRAKEIKAEEQKHRLESEKIDVTMPGKRHELGSKHPLSIVLDEIKEIFVGMGFDIVEGPEVEYDYYNF
jgi:phenylalanyl-tRNA synthetase alpha chain